MPITREEKDDMLVRVFINSGEFEKEALVSEERRSKHTITQPALKRLVTMDEGTFDEVRKLNYFEHPSEEVGDRQ